MVERLQFANNQRSRGAHSPRREQDGGLPLDYGQNKAYQLHGLIIHFRHKSTISKHYRNCHTSLPAAYHFRPAILTSRLYRYIHPCYKFIKR